MKPKEVIEKAINIALSESGLLLEGDNYSDYIVEHPGDETHGDYATNVSLQAFKRVQSNIHNVYLHKKPVRVSSPREMAESLVKVLKRDKSLAMVVDLDKIEIAGPGFINFWLKESYLLEEMKQAAAADKDYGKGVWGKGKRVLVDYSSPNIAKAFSVGHLRSTVIGQAIYNLYKFGGWEAVGDNHLGDWGTQFGMIVAAVEEKGLEIEKMSVEEMESLYVEFNNRVKETPELKDMAREAFARLEEGEKGAREIWKAAVRASLIEFDKIYDMLGVKIDYAYGESAYEEEMREVIKEAGEKGIAKKSEGAMVIDTGHSAPAILVKGNGTTTYFTRDMATIRFRRRSSHLKAERYVYEVGAEQTLHFRQLFKAAEMMGWGKKEDYVHIAHGMVLGNDGKKMSTRKGTNVKMQDLLTAMVEKAGSVNPDSAKEVGIGAIKFADLKHSPQSDYVFDMEKALSLSGDSGPYVQYAVVRIKSILEKSKVKSEGELLEEMKGEEKQILRWLYRFGEITQEAAMTFSPNLLVEYLLEGAERFNRFYNQHRVIGDKNEHFRLSLSKGVRNILEKGLNLLGIEVPEKM